MAITGKIEGLGDISLDTGPMEKVFDDLTKSIKSLKKDLKEKESVDKKNTEAKNDNTDVTNDNTNSVKQNSKTSRALAQRFGFAAGVMAELSDITFRLTSNFSTLGNNIESANRMTFGQIPVLGPALNSIVSASTQVVNRFNQVAGAGATFGGSVFEMSRQAAQSGMALDEYTSFISQNAMALRFLGGTVEQGAMQFSAMSKELRANNRDLFGLGFSIRDINDGLASYTRQLGLQGRAESMSRTDLITGTATYLKTLDALAKATGETRREVEQRRMQMATDEQFLASMIGLSDEVARSFLDAVGGIAPGLQSFAKDILAVGVATTQENQLLMAMLPESAANLIEFQQKLQRGEVVTLEERNRLNNLLAAEGAANLENIKAAAAASPELRSVVAGITEAMRMQEDALKRSTAEQQAAAASQEALFQAVEQGRKNIAELSNTLLAFLANESVMQDLTMAFKSLLEITTDYLIPFLNNTLIPVAKTLASNLELVIGALIAYHGRLLWAKTGMLGAFAPFAKIGLVIVGVISAITLFTSFLNRRRQEDAKIANDELQKKTRATNELVNETEAAANRLAGVKPGAQGSIAVLNQLIRPAGTEGSVINKTRVDVPTAEGLRQTIEDKEEALAQARIARFDASGVDNNAEVVRLGKEIELLTESLNNQRDLLKQIADNTKDTADATQNNNAVF